MNSLPLLPRLLGDAKKIALLFFVPLVLAAMYLVMNDPDYFQIDANVSTFKIFAMFYLPFTFAAVCWRGFNNRSIFWFMVICAVTDYTLSYHISAYLISNNWFFPLIFVPLGVTLLCTYIYFFRCHLLFQLSRILFRVPLKITKRWAIKIAKSTHGTKLDWYVKFTALLYAIIFTPWTLYAAYLYQIELPASFESFSTLMTDGLSGKMIEWTYATADVVTTFDIVVIAYFCLLEYKHPDCVSLNNPRLNRIIKNGL